MEFAWTLLGGNGTWLISRNTHTHTHTHTHTRVCVENICHESVFLKVKKKHGSL
jgi:hypothetical protein